MDRLNFYIDWYHKEIERQHTLNEAVNIPVGILTGIFAIYAFLINGYNYDVGYLALNCMFFHGFMLLSIFLWIGVLVNISKSYNNHFKGHEYSYLPFVSNLESHYNGLKSYVLSYHTQLPPGTTPDTLFDIDIMGLLENSIDKNTKSNTIKSAHLFVAKRWLLGCIISLLLALIPFVFNFLQFNRQNKIQEISISNLSDLTRRTDTVIIRIDHGKASTTQHKSNTSTPTKATSIKGFKRRAPSSSNEKQSRKGKISRCKKNKQ